MGHQLITDYKPYIDALEVELRVRERQFKELVASGKHAKGTVRTVEPIEGAMVATLDMQVPLSEVTGLSGDFVSVSKYHTFKASRTGIVMKDLGDECQIVFDPGDEPNVGEVVYFLPPDMSQLLINRINLLKAVRGRTTSKCEWIDDFLRGDTEPEAPPPADVEFFDEELNEDQQEAVRQCRGLSDESPFYLILGPPGTGKTTVITEIVRHAIKEGLRVLVTAHTHVAIDNMLEKLIKDDPETARLSLRFGHIGKIAPSVRSLSITEKMKATKIENVRDLVNQHQVFGATLLSGVEGYLEWKLPDLVIVDEASQADLSLSLLALDRANRVIFVGDPCQLPPICKPGTPTEVGQSFFEKVFDTYRDRFSTMLPVQYRSNRRIVEYSSRFIYKKRTGRELVSHENVADAVLPELPQGSFDNELAPYLRSEHPVVWMDTKNLSRNCWTDEHSAYNVDEAAIVTGVVEQLRKHYKARQIGVICPFRGQVTLLNKEFARRKVEVDTIDRYQGREKDIVVLDLVMNQKRINTLLFRKDNRLNVGLTRAKRKLIIVGSSRIGKNYPDTYGELHRLVRSFTPDLPNELDGLPECCKKHRDIYLHHAQGMMGWGVPAEVSHVGKQAPRIAAPATNQERTGNTVASTPPSTAPRVGYHCPYCNADFINFMARCPHCGATLNDTGTPPPSVERSGSSSSTVDVPEYTLPSPSPSDIKKMVGWHDINRRIKACKRKRSRKEVIESLEELFRSTNDGLVAFFLGKEHESAGDLKIAEEYFRKAERLFPLEKYKGFARNAADKVRKSIEGRGSTDSKKESTRRKLSWKEINKRIKEAKKLSSSEERIRALEDLFRIKEDGMVSYNLAKEYESIGHYSRAKEFYEKTIAYFEPFIRNPRNPMEERISTDMVRHSRNGVDRIRAIEEG